MQNVSIPLNIDVHWTVARQKWKWMNVTHHVEKHGRANERWQHVETSSLLWHVYVDGFQQADSSRLPFSAVSVDHVTVVLRVGEGPPLSLPSRAFCFVSRHWLNRRPSCDRPRTQEPPRWLVNQNGGEVGFRRALFRFTYWEKKEKTDGKNCNPPNDHCLVTSLYGKQFCARQTAFMFFAHLVCVPVPAGKFSILAHKCRRHQGLPSISLPLS